MGLIYMAPMEGLTGYVWRNAYHRNFGNVDRYFTPFITNKKLNYKEINDILPEHNIGMEVVPQILTNRAEDFLCIVKELQQYGYDKVNLNLGCPSGTVVSKNRGAGFLGVPEQLDAFLAEIFDKCPIEISIKTRIGKIDADEWEDLLFIYEKYPMEELIIHPRVQRDFYRNTVNLDAFEKAVELSRHTLCYNGDICTAADYERVVTQFPKVERVMIGRGILKNPFLVEQIRAWQATEESEVKMPEQAEEFRMQTVGCTNGKDFSEQEKKSRLREYHDDVLSGYAEVMYGDSPTLFKMKELWVYLAESFISPEKYMKKIRKCERIRDYEIVVDALFRECDLKR